MLFFIYNIFSLASCTTLYRPAEYREGGFAPNTTTKNKKMKKISRTNKSCLLLGIFVVFFDTNAFSLLIFLCIYIYS